LCHAAHCGRHGFLGFVVSHSVRPTEELTNDTTPWISNAVVVLSHKKYPRPRFSFLADSAVSRARQSPAFQGGYRARCLPNKEIGGNGR
jgi:hypothetical protein